MFEIKRENKNGTFHVKLNHDPSVDEMVQLASLANNIIKREVVQDDVNGPWLQQASSSPTAFTQVKLGENPVSDINIGSYVQPSFGVRIKMVAIPEVRMQAIRILREATGISLIGCKDIIFGNYPCPLLKQEVAESIIKSFKSAEVYATIVPENSAA